MALGGATIAAALAAALRKGLAKGVYPFDPLSSLVGLRRTTVGTHEPTAAARGPCLSMDMATFGRLHVSVGTSVEEAARVPAQAVALVRALEEEAPSMARVVTLEAGLVITSIEAEDGPPSVIVDIVQVAAALPSHRGPSAFIIERVSCGS